MWLDEWLLKRYMKANTLAQMLDVHPQYLYAIISGRKTCGKKLAKKIVEVTEGQVTEEDIFRGPKRLSQKTS